MNGDCAEEYNPKSQQVKKTLASQSAVSIDSQNSQPSNWLGRGFYLKWNENRSDVGRGRQYQKVECQLVGQ